MTPVEPLGRQSDFAIFLRTGRRFRHQAGADVEVKFNHWHDPDDGRFTFRDQGQYFGEGSGRGSAVGGSEARVRRNSSGRIDVSKTGRSSKSKTWSGGEFTGGGGGSFGGAGASASGWETADERRRREAKQVRLQAVRPTGLRQMVAAKPVQAGDRRNATVHNGYRFETDSSKRVRHVSGVIPPAGRTKRSPTMQKAAGGPDRLPTDDGGHYVAPRFNEPRIELNHFPQNLSINRGEYRVIEDRWDKARKDGHRVEIDVSPIYSNTSQRPDALNVVWFIDGRRRQRVLLNHRKDSKHGR